MTVRFQLDNGFTVLLEEHHAARVAAFQVWVRAGSADERPDQAGLAHLHEHMLFKGTEGRAPGEIARDIEAHGGEINAWTSFDQTVYHVVMASAFAYTGLEILADAVRRSAFDPGELSREIEVVCEEIKRSFDLPSRRASRELFETAFKVHPYSRPVIGWEDTVRSFTREKVLEFYERHYTPDNMVLAAAGDLTEEQLRAWATTLFGGDWGRPFKGPVPRAAEPAFSERRLHVRKDEVKEAYLNLAFPIPEGTHPDTPALDVLAMLLGQGDASQLSLEVKRQRSLVNEVHAYAYTPKDPGLFITSLQLPKDKLTEAVVETLRVLQRARQEPVSVDELRTVQALIESENVYQRETVQGVARKLGFYEASGGGLWREAEYYQRVAQLTPSDLQAAAQRYLDPARLVASALVPTDAAFGEAELASAIDRGVGEKSPVRAVPKATSLPPAPMQVVSQAPDKVGPKVEVLRLRSGATVLVREERAVPLVAIRAVAHGGVRFEDDKVCGISALVSRMLTRGTEAHDAVEISRLLDAMAGSMGGTAGRSSLGLRCELLSRHFDRGFELFTQCLLHPTFRDEEVERERALLLQDIHTKEDKPSSIAFELLAKALYPEHPYRLPLSGELSSVQALTRSALVDYQRRHFAPERLVLSVVGDVSAAHVLEIAEPLFGPAREAPPPLPTVPPVAPLTSPRKLDRVLAKAQTHLVLGFLGARVNDRWRRALEILSAALSGQGGRLFTELRDKRSLAYSVSSYNVEGVDPGYFAVYIGTSPEKVPAALTRIEAELRRVREDRISPKELERAQRHLVGTYEIGLQRNGARAGVLGLDHLYGLGHDAWERYADEILAVTAEEVREVAERVIDFSRMASSQVGPA